MGSKGSLFGKAALTVSAAALAVMTAFSGEETGRPASQNKRRVERGAEQVGRSGCP